MKIYIILAFIGCHFCSCISPEQQARERAARQESLQRLAGNVDKVKIGQTLKEVVEILGLSSEFILKLESGQDSLDVGGGNIIYFKDGVVAGVERKR